MLQTIKQDITSAMKQKDKPKTTLLKLVLGKAQAIAKEETREVTDADVMTAITKEVKQINQALSMVESKGLSTENEFYTRQVYDLSVLTAYLPAQLSEAELATQMREVLATIDTSNKGLVMKTVMSQFKGKADGKLINQVVTTLLAE